MYITAHTVRDDQERTGTNSFRYEENENGNRVLADHIASLPPGNNSVLAYLDVFCDDSATREEVESALCQYEEKFGVKPSTRTINRMTITFSCTVGMRGREKEQFDTLRTAVLRMVVA